MKHLFFQKGQKIAFSPNGQNIIQTSNNLDSKKYVLEKIPIQIFNSQQHYIQNHFFFSREDNLISYFNCWKETENVPMDKPMIKQKQRKKDKKTTMADVMRRKGKVQNQQTIAPSKKKIKQQNYVEAFVTQQFVYVQMEYFSEIQIPHDFVGIRDLMAVIYLLGKRIEKKTGNLPCLIPVKNQQNDRIKFFKKGQSIQYQLHKLMIYLFNEKQQIYLKQWSENLQKAIHKAEINRDEQLIGDLLKNAIEEYLNSSFQIGLTNQEQKIFSVQTVKIVDYETLILEQSQIEVPLDEYKIEYLLKSQVDRQITLTHEVFQSYVFFGKKSNFIVKWLYHMAT